MTYTDLYTLLFYVLGVFAVGVLFSTKVKNSRDMFSAGGAAPWWAAGLSGFMTMFSAGTFVVWGGIAFRLGLVAVMINLCYGIAALLVGFLVAGRWSNLGIRTPAEFVELRFGKRALHFYTWSMMFYRLLGVAVALYSLAILMAALMPLSEGNPFRDPATGNLSVAWAIVFFGGLVVCYTMLGGLWAVLMTDVLQFIVLNLSVLFLIPLILYQVGGLRGLIEKSPSGFFSPVAGGYTWIFLVGWTLIHFFVIGAEWAFVQRHLCVADARAAKKATYLFGMLYLVSPILWLLPPMAFRILEPDVDPEQAYILSCCATLPVGMVGLMLAAMFSATASMVSSQINVFAGVLTENFYRSCVPDASESHILRVGRIFSLLLGVVIVAIALAVPGFGGAEKVVVAFTSLLVTPLLAPLLWGLFSTTLPAKAVWLTALPPFVIGLAVSSTLIIDRQLLGKSSEELTGFSALVDSWGPYREMVIGVAFPVLILLGITLSNRETSAGWKRLEAALSERAAGKEQASSQPVPFDHWPASIVGISLLGCGILMLGLAIMGETERLTLSIFGGILLALATAIGYLTRLKTLQSRRKMAKTIGQIPTPLT